MSQRVLTLAYVVVDDQNEPVTNTISGNLYDIGSTLMTLGSQPNLVSVVLSADDQQVAISLV